MAAVAVALPVHGQETLPNRPLSWIGRIEDGQVRLDLRGLDGAAAEQAFVAQLPALTAAAF